MELTNLNTQLIDWESIPPIETKGKTGVNTAHEFSAGGYKIRLSVYSANYESDHWCEKGHIIHCVEGSLILKIKDREDIYLSAGRSLLLAENDQHMAVTGDDPAKIFIID
jgi:mannose-6-phosphate isomerase class I